MVIFLYGPNSYRRLKRVETLKKAFQDKFDRDGHNVTTIEGIEFDHAHFHTMTRSGGLFATKRFIVLKDIWKIPQEQQKQLEEMLTHVVDDTIICISTDAPPRKDNALFKSLLTAHTVEEYGDLNHSQLRAFITQECKKKNATIDTQAIAILIREIGNDLWRLHTTLNTLAHYTPHITAETVSLFVETALNDSIFDLTDAVGEKNAPRALQLLEEQFLLGYAAPYLITMLGKHIHTVLLVSLAGNQATALPLHPYVVQKAAAQSKRFSVEDLKKLYQQLIDIDEKTKTTRIDPAVLLNQCIVAACQ